MSRMNIDEEDDGLVASSSESSPAHFSEELEVLPTSPPPTCFPSLPKCSSPSSSVPLEPFLHQVGGHFPMACLDKNIVCKLLNEHEHKFYKKMHPDLVPFAPRYEGTMEVDVHADDQGFITLAGQPPPKFTGLAAPSQIVSLHHSGDPNHANDASKNRTSHKESTDGKANNEQGLFCNPWALKCHKDNLIKMGLLSPKKPTSEMSSSSSSSSKPNDTKKRPQVYLLLENLVSKYVYPCVLDLKVGKKQYTNDMSAAKKARKMAKVASTTSGTLGLRLCGMQVFDSVAGDFVCRNKYFGRSLNDKSFKSALKDFFTVASPLKSTIRHNVIERVSGRLNGLIDVVNRLDSYRFYTSSLLITYDGGLPADVIDVEVVADVRLIDFAHSTNRDLEEAEDDVRHGPDTGFLQGLRNLMTLLEEISRSN